MIVEASEPKAVKLISTFLEVSLLDVARLIQAVVRFWVNNRSTKTRDGLLPASWSASL